MNLTFLDKQSKVAPLLVRLYDSQRLSASAISRNASVKEELADAVCELMGMELTPRESELVADVMIGLLRQAELDFRAALSERLAGLDNVPLRLVLKLADDEPSVSAPMLERSNVLTDLDLSYIIKSQGPEYWRAIAKREGMSDQLVNMLVDTKDVPTAINLTQNNNIILNDYAVNTLSEMAKESDALAMPLLQREEVPTAIAKKLYQFVGQEIKTYIETQFGITKGAVADAVEEVLVDFVEGHEGESPYMPTNAMVKDAVRQNEKGLLTMKMMIGSLRRGQFKAFVAQFSAFSAFTPDFIIEILEQPSGQALVVACKANDIRKEDFVSIYMLSNCIRNKNEMVELGDLSKAMGYYQKMDKEMAENIIRNTREG